jgi:hypothetical protein
MACPEGNLDGGGDAPSSGNRAERESIGIDAIKAEVRRGTHERVTDILSSIKLDIAMRQHSRESEHFAASEYSPRSALSIGRIPERFFSD